MEKYVINASSEEINSKMSGRLENFVQKISCDVSQFLISLHYLLRTQSENQEQNGSILQYVLVQSKNVLNKKVSNVEI